MELAYLASTEVAYLASTELGDQPYVLWYVLCCLQACIPQLPPACMQPLLQAFRASSKYRGSRVACDECVGLLHLFRPSSWRDPASAQTLLQECADSYTHLTLPTKRIV